MFDSESLAGQETQSYKQSKLYVYANGFIAWLPIPYFHFGPAALADQKNRTVTLVSTKDPTAKKQMLSRFELTPQCYP